MTGRWDELFGDIEAQLDAAQGQEQADEVAERTRHELGLRSLGDRLRAVRGEAVLVGLAGHGPMRMAVLEVGPDWLLGQDLYPAAEVLVALAAVDWVDGLGREAGAAPAGRVWSRCDLRMSIRGLVRERSPVTVLLGSGGDLTGTLDRVGSDHVDVAVHPADVLRRAAHVQRVRSVALTAIAAIRRLP